MPNRPPRVEPVVLPPGFFPALPHDFLARALAVPDEYRQRRATLSDLHRVGDQLRVEIDQIMRSRDITA